MVQRGPTKISRPNPMAVQNIRKQSLEVCSFISVTRLNTAIRNHYQSSVLSGHQKPLVEGVPAGTIPLPLEGIQGWISYQQKQSAVAPRKPLGCRPSLVERIVKSPGGSLPPLHEPCQCHPLSATHASVSRPRSLLIRLYVMSSPRSSTARPSQQRQKDNMQHVGP